MANAGRKTVTLIVWVFCILLYVFALLSHFAVISTTGTLGDWAWIAGFGLLLIATRIGND